MNGLNTQRKKLRVCNVSGAMPWSWAYREWFTDPLMPLASLHTARLFQLYMKDEIKACPMETLKALAGSGRHCSDEIFRQKCPSTTQMTVREPCSSDVSSPISWRLDNHLHRQNPVLLGFQCLWK